MEWTDIKDIAISVAAMIGMFLGIWNFISEKKQQKVKLKVTPLSIRNTNTMQVGANAFRTSSDHFSLEDMPDGLAIEIVNMSLFPVTITEVGLHAPKRLNRFAVPLPELTDNGKWPRKLESREKVTAIIDWPSLLESEGTNLIKTAYASTACGATIKGTSKAMESFIKQVCIE